MKQLISAVLQVMEEVNYVEKTGDISIGRSGYTYASELDLLLALRPAMIKAGLVLIPTGIDIALSERYNNDKMHHVVTKNKFVLLHTSGEQLEIEVAGEGADNGDKAIPKALTGALKYAFRQTFAVPTGDDPDEVPSTELEKEDKQPNKKQTRKPPVKKEEQESDDDKLSRALEYKIPDDMIGAGDTLQKWADKSDPTGALMIVWLAGKDANGSNEWFNEEQVEDWSEYHTKLQNAARYVLYNYNKGELKEKYEALKAKRGEDPPPWDE